MGATKVDKLIREEIEQSERTRDRPPTGEAGVRRHQDAARVYSVRLQPSLVDELEAVAKELDVPTRALIRGFITDGLAAHKEDTMVGLVDHVENDLRRLRGLLS